MNAIESHEEYFEATFKKLEQSNDVIKSTEFEECEFIDCDLSSVLFKNCRFNNCEFSGCNLSLINLSGSKLFTVEFKDCKLVGVDWTQATWPSYHLDFELAFQRCILNDNSFFGLTLNELKIDECKLHDVDFREGNFDDSSITYSDFTHSLFMRTSLKNVDFTESTAYAINVLENDIKGAKFSRYEALNLLEGLGIELVD